MIPTSTTTNLLYDPSIEFLSYTTMILIAFEIDSVFLNNNFYYIFHPLFYPLNNLKYTYYAVFFKLFQYF